MKTKLIILLFLLSLSVKAQPFFGTGPIYINNMFLTTNLSDFGPNTNLAFDISFGGNVDKSTIPISAMVPSVQSQFNAMTNYQPSFSYTTNWFPSIPWTNNTGHVVEGDIVDTNTYALVGGQTGYSWYVNGLLKSSAVQGSLSALLLPPSVASLHVAIPVGSVALLTNQSTVGTATLGSGEFTQLP